MPTTQKVRASSPPGAGHSSTSTGSAGAPAGAKKTSSTGNGDGNRYIGSARVICGDTIEAPDLEQQSTGGWMPRVEHHTGVVWEWSQEAVESGQSCR